MSAGQGGTLDGKTAIVTGASGELGLAMAQALAQAGAAVVLVGRRRDALEDAGRRLGLDRSRVLLHPTDVTDAGQVEGLAIAAVERFGRVDVLVTAAAVQVRKPALEFTLDEWNRVLAANLTGTFLCCQAVGRRMVQQGGGKIIMVTSLTAEIGLPNMAAYAASKGGLRQLCKALAAEWAPFGVTVNCVGPGRFRTKMTEAVFADETTRQSFLKLIPLGRAGVPADLAAATVFLASSGADYITGQSLYIDGGWLAAGGNPQG